MTQQIARYMPPVADPQPMDLATLGKVLAQSGYFQDSRDASQAIVKVLAGQEMGIGPIAAMTGIYLVKGRVTLGATLIASQIKRHPNYDFRVVALDDNGCTLAFFERHNGQMIEVGRSSFTKADATSAGLLGNDTYKKFPRNMYFSRALTNGARWYAPDVFGGAPVYTPDEMGEAGAIDTLPAVAYVDSATGEVAAPPQQPAQTVEGAADDDRFVSGLIGGVVRSVEGAYTKSGKLTLRMTVFCQADQTDYTAMYINAPAELIEVEQGDEVVITGEMKQYKGADVIQVSALSSPDVFEDPTESPWSQRAAIRAAKEADMQVAA